jgi:hypothetical protein
MTALPLLAEQEFLQALDRHFGDEVRVLIVAVALAALAWALARVDWT